MSVARVVSEEFVQVGRVVQILANEKCRANIPIYTYTQSVECVKEVSGTEYKARVSCVTP